MTEQVPPWLMVMRGITGMTEDPGSGDNPRILHMADAIAREYPHQADYCAYYTGDDIAWCGLTVGYCMALSGIEPVFGETDTERWMWALAWSEWPDSERLTSPELGCIVVTEREGGGHVTLYEKTEGGVYKCRGGNQSDMVNVTSIDPGTVVALVWPRPRMIPDIVTPSMTSTEVTWTQASLNLLDDTDLELDGDLGPMTSDAIQQYQHEHLLPVTGKADKRTVNQMLDDLGTWNERRYIEAPAPELPSEGVPPLLPPLSGELRDEIISMAEASTAFDYEWKDRGPAPAGYCNGMAVTYANQVRKYLLGYSGQTDMAKAARTNDPDDDALTWYAQTFGALGMSNGTDGLDTMRHLWTLLWGLGMRESSGQYCCGRDQSASNTDGETCEAGLFQTSHNCFAASDEMDKAMKYFQNDGAYYEGGRDTFKQEVECSQENWACYGTGIGEEYQQLAKEMPAFAAESTAIGLRHNRQHWGPINRHEAEVRPEVDRLLKDIEKLFAGPTKVTS